ncbi:transcription termination factor NusA [bacterium]|nr:transcription termination factor NusA [bacterium]
MNQEIIEAFKEIAKIKNLEKESLVDIIENTFYLMIKKKYGDFDNFDVIVNMDKGEIEIYQSKLIVEEVENPVTQISLADAQKIEPDLELDEMCVESIDTESFGRRAIISAKQNLTQKIREAEKEIVYEEFKNRVGDIIIGDVNQINRDEIFINVEKTEILLPKKEQIYNERYRRGDSIRALIKGVVRTPRGPEIIASRTSPQFLVKLFEIEVPEIYDNIIEIKGIAREAGDRAKVAVISNDKRIDPVGACVGMKGVRIQSIVKELNNEKIDIISWNEDAKSFITQALSPSKPIDIIVDEENKTARAIIPDDQISLAIGRGGQNIRLASLLTKYQIETVKESASKKKEEEKIDIRLVEKLSGNLQKKLIEHGYETAEQVLDAGSDSLQEVPGIGEKRAREIIELLESFYE